IEIIKESRVGIAQPFQIVLFDLLLITDPAARDAAHQHVRRSLQIHDEIRRRRIEIERSRHLIVQPELVGIEIQLGEEPILLDQKIRYTHRREQVALSNLLDLPGALEQKEQLRRQSGVFAIAIEALEKRILIRLLQNQLAREARRQALRQTGLADAYRSLHDDISWT